MTFSEKLKSLRQERQLTQAEVANAVGMSRRTYINYEDGSHLPRTRETYQKLADVLQCNINYLLTEEEAFVTEAAEKYGYNGKKQAETLVSELTGLFAGGSLADADKDAIMAALTEAYFISKQENKKYIPKKYRK